MNNKLTIFIFFTIMIVSLGIFYRPKTSDNIPNAYEVIKYMDNSIYNDNVSDYYLLFDEFKLDSNNFTYVLSFLDKYSYEIIEVYPYINPIYQDKLESISKIIYNSKSLDNGISIIYNKYLKVLEDNYLTDEVDKTLVNGVRIRMIRININSASLREFLSKYNDIKYSTTASGLFKSFKL